MEEKKSILKEALTEYQEMVEAANKLAAEKLSKEFPEKFNSYLKEELNNTNTKESDLSDKKIKESTDNKLDEGIKKNREETMKKEQKETQAGVKNKEKETKEVVAENYGYDSEVEDVDLKTKEYGADIPDEDREYSERGRPTDSESEPDDYVLKDIEKEIDKMELMEKELQEREEAVTHNDSVSFLDKNSGGVAFDELVKIKSMLDEILNKAEEKEFNDDSSENFVDENNDELTDAELDELLEEITTDNVEDEFDSLSNEIEPDLDEHHGITHAARKKVTSKLPRKGQGLPTSHEPQLRYAMQEADRKVKNLIETNKKSTKSLNENKKKVKVLTELVEGYKNALEKYRDQLKSMSVFNTNLAHVNNILVNEELALTQDDKIRVINEFKELNSIAKSEKKYKEVLNEFKNVDKKKINENLSDKLNKSSSVQSSSKKALEEVIEKTAYENNEHINRIKKINEFLDKRTNKKII